MRPNFLKHMLRETCASVVLFFLYCLGKIILDFRNVKQLKYPFFPFHIWSMSCTVVCSVIYGVSSTKSKTGFRKFSGCNTKFDHLIWIYGWESYQWLAQGPASVIMYWWNETSLYFPPTWVINLNLNLTWTLQCVLLASKLHNKENFTQLKCVVFIPWPGI